MKHPIRTLSALLVTLLASVGTANATLLSMLLNGGSITAGDKLFDNWKLMNYTASDPARNFNAANIDVQPLNDGGLDPGPGLKFIVSNNELTVTGDDLYAFVDLMFGFHVTVLDPALKVKDNSLTYSPGGAFLAWTVDGSYDLGSYVRETIGSAEGLDDLGVKDIEFSLLNDPVTGQFAVSKFADSAQFPPRHDIWVTKNILVWAADSTDTAGLTGFEQRFSQVPEPATLALTTLGLAGMLVGRRRKRL